MQSSGATLFSILLLVSFTSAPASAQADGDIVVQSIAETEVEVISSACPSALDAALTLALVPG